TREHIVLILANGKVLVTGGNNGNIILNSTELYDPSIGIWTATDNMNSARSDHTASILNNEKVLITGGYHNVSKITNSVELY
ncbi:unnamed protein product, partial [Rotaria sp. Silwood2]